MFQKIINYIKPAQIADEQRELSKREKKVEEMKKLVNMNEYFQCPDKLISDAEYVINWFCDDKIDIYIPDHQETILYILGFIEISVKNRPFKIVIHLQFFQGYPYQICNISFENKSLKEKDIKINPFYQQSLQLEQILLNQYLLQAQTWLNHKDLKLLLDEVKQVLEKRFPYQKVKSEIQYFSAEPLKPQIQEQNKQQEVIPNQVVEEPKKEEKSINIIQPPMVPLSNKIYGPSGLLLDEENKLQQEVTKFTIQSLKQHRNDIVGMKNYFQEMKIYKQQQSGLKLQLVWLRQQLDSNLEMASKYYGELQQQLNNSSQETTEAIECDSLSNQIIDLLAEIKAKQDCYSYISTRFKQGRIDYGAMCQQTATISEQQFYQKLLLNKIKLIYYE